MNFGFLTLLLGPKYRLQNGTTFFPAVSFLFSYFRFSVFFSFFVFSFSGFRFSFAVSSKIKRSKLIYSRNYPPMLGTGGLIFSPGPRIQSVPLYENGSIYLFGGGGMLKKKKATPKRERNKKKKNVYKKRTKRNIQKKSVTFILYKTDGYFAYFNDVWSYEIETGAWYWIGGTSADFSPALSFSPRGDNSLLLPPGRFTSEFVNILDGVVIYGGKGHDANMNVVTLGDMWMLNLGMYKPEKKKKGNK